MGTLTSDLHVHLYGCLTAEDLWEQAQRMDHPKWEWFESEYQAAFGIHPNMSELCALPKEEGLPQLKQLFLLKEAAPFSQFQAKFNLIIALSDLESPTLIEQVTKQVLQRHHKEGLTYVEYRMLLPPWTTQKHAGMIIRTICKTMHQFEGQSGFEGRFSLSLPRQMPEGAMRYEWLRSLMEEDPIVAKITTSVDFCFFEEGHPPKEQRVLFDRIHADNQRDPQKALAILYHVGECFSDKSLESAIRWVHQSALFGAHRLGHAIVLGVALDGYLGSFSEESVEERIDQIQYDLELQAELKAAGILVEEDSLKQEYETLSSQDPTSLIQREYTVERVQDIQKRQDWVMASLKKHSICIEACPTSNLRIGMIEDAKKHPIHRFLEQGVPLVIGSDDPGIFDITLDHEWQWCQQHASEHPESLQNIPKNLSLFRSEKLSGRLRNS